MVAFVAPLVATAFYLLGYWHGGRRVIAMLKQDAHGRTPVSPGSASTG